MYIGAVEDMDKREAEALQNICKAVHTNTSDLAKDIISDRERMMHQSSLRVCMNRLALTGQDEQEREKIRAIFRELLTELQKGGTVKIDSMSIKMGISIDRINNIVEEIKPHPFYVDVATLDIKLGNHVHRTIDPQSLLP